jgi:hypothetical protein
MQSALDMQRRVELLMAQLPVGALEGLVTFLEILVRQDEGGRQIAGDGIVAQYDFSDLTGRLSWRGDAVEVQRVLRDEW